MYWNWRDWGELMGFENIGIEISIVEGCVCVLVQSTERTWRSDSPVAMSIPGTQILISQYHTPQKGSLENNVNPKVWAGMILEYIFCASK